MRQNLISYKQVTCTINFFACLYGIDPLIMSYTHTMLHNIYTLHVHVTYHILSAQYNDDSLQ